MNHQSLKNPPLIKILSQRQKRKQKLWNQTVVKLFSDIINNDDLGKLYCIQTQIQNKILLKYDTIHYKKTIVNQNNPNEQKNAEPIDQTNDMKTLILDQNQYMNLKEKIKRAFKREGIFSQSRNYINPEKVIMEILNGIIIKFKKVLEQKSQINPNQDYLEGFNEFIYCYKRADFKIQPIYVPGMRWICLKLIRQIVRICVQSSQFRQLMMIKFKRNYHLEYINEYGEDADLTKKQINNRLDKILLNIVDSQNKLRQLDATQVKIPVKIKIPIQPQIKKSKPVQLLIDKQNKGRFFKQVYDYCCRNLCQNDEDNVIKYSSLRALRIHCMQNKKFQNYHCHQSYKTQIDIQKIRNKLDGNTQIIYQTRKYKIHKMENFNSLKQIDIYQFGQSVRKFNAQFIHIQGKKQDQLNQLKQIQKIFGKNTSYYLISKLEQKKIDNKNHLKDYKYHIKQFQESCKTIKYQVKHFKLNLKFQSQKQNSNINNNNNNKNNGFIQQFYVSQFQIDDDLTLKFNQKLDTINNNNYIEQFISWLNKKLSQKQYHLKQIKTSYDVLTKISVETWNKIKINTKFLNVISQQSLIKKQPYICYNLQLDNQKQPVIITIHTQNPHYNFIIVEIENIQKKQHIQQSKNRLLNYQLSKKTQKQLYDSINIDLQTFQITTQIQPVDYPYVKKIRADFKNQQKKLQIKDKQIIPLKTFSKYGQVTTHDVTQSKQLKSLRIMTWNLFNQQYKAKQRIQNIFKLIKQNKPDIICLQQVDLFYKEFVKLVINQLVQYELDEYYYPSLEEFYSPIEQENQNQSIIQVGQNKQLKLKQILPCSMILSKFPTKFYLHPIASKKLCFCPLKLKLEGEEKQLNLLIYSMHLKAITFNPNRKQSRQQQKKNCYYKRDVQIKQLNQLFLKNNYLDLLILAGDFNIGQSQYYRYQNDFLKNNFNDVLGIYKLGFIKYQHHPSHHFTYFRKNQHQEHSRFDRILLKNMKPASKKEKAIQQQIFKERFFIKELKQIGEFSLQAGATYEQVMKDGKCRGSSDHLGVLADIRLGLKSNYLQ